jgi:hypothetical protein
MDGVPAGADSLWPSVIHGNRCLAAIQKTPFWDFMDGMKLPPKGQFTWSVVFFFFFPLSLFLIMFFFFFLLSLFSWAFFFLSFFTWSVVFFQNFPLSLFLIMFFFSCSHTELEREAGRHVGR